MSAAPCAFGQEAGPTAEELAAAIRKSYDSLPGLHLKWDIATHTHVTLPDDIVLRVTSSLDKADEFAIDGGQHIRRRVWAQFYKQQRWRESVYIMADGTLHWQEIDYAEPSASTPVDMSNYHITEHDGTMPGYVHRAAHYLEFVGSPFYDGEQLEVWRAHKYYSGMPASAPFSPPRAFSVVRALESGQYSIRSSPDTVDGNRCWVAESPGHDTLWLAAEQGLALVRRDWCWADSSEVMCRYVNRELEEVAPGVWLPRTASRTMMVNTSKHAQAAAGTPHFTTVADLTFVTAADLDESLFVHDPPAGTHVADDTHLALEGEPVTLIYKWGKTAAETEAALRQSLSRVEANRRASSASPGAWLWLIVANVAVLLLVSAAILVRRRRAHG